MDDSIGRFSLKCDFCFMHNLWGNKLFAISSKGVLHMWPRIKRKLIQDFLWSWLVVWRPWSKEFTILIESLHHKTWLKANLDHDVVFWMRTKKQIKIKMTMFAQIGFTKYIHVILHLMKWLTYFLLRHPI